ncbi:MAG: taurine transporter substrate binding subunit [Paenibacillaceae bacterium]|jgi:ABC-type nitrate/sulfonate/bicarbonate transport system substrate-binding protein|nr:taurine transporter substrate binding subunit [Paenibacillaceae bacterium]
MTRFIRMKPLSVVLLLLSLWIVLAGCGEKEAVQAGGVPAASNASAAPASGSAGEKELFSLKLTSPSGSGVSPTFIAEHLGFFKENGIKADFVGAIDSGKQLSSVVAGKLDVGGGHINRTIAGISGGAKVRAVVAGSETDKDYPHMTFAVLKDSPIKTAADLIGTKHGASAYGGCMEYTPYEYMRLNGKVKDPKEDLELVIIPVGQEVQALRQKQVESIAVSGNAQYVLNNSPDLRLLFTDYDVWGTVGGNTAGFFAQSFIDKHPDIVKGYVAAIGKSYNWINEHRDEALEITAKEFKVDRAKINIMNYPKDGVIKEDSVQLWIDTLNYYKEIKPGIKPADIYTNEFNPYYKP